MTERASLKVGATTTSLDATSRTFGVIGDDSTSFVASLLSLPAKESDFSRIEFAEDVGMEIASMTLCLSAQAPVGVSSARKRRPMAIAVMMMKGTMKDTRQATCSVRP